MDALINDDLLGLIIVLFSFVFLGLVITHLKDDPKSLSDLLKEPIKKIEEEKDEDNKFNK